MVYHKQPKQVDWSNLFQNNTAIQYNHFLQYVELPYTISVVKDKNVLNPFFKDFTNWECSPVRERIFMTRFENEEILERDKTKYLIPGTRCDICKGVGHPKQFCLKRIVSAHRLGLVHHGEILLYQFLINIEISPIPNIDWNDLPSVIKIQQDVIKLEKTFLKMLRTFFVSRNYPQWRILFNPYFFSKGRQTLGSQWSMGAYRWQLILSAFGCTIDLINPPPSCEITCHDSLTPEMIEEDHADLQQGKIAIIPEKFATYILKRKQVTNSDTTTRTINDCRPLGIHTYTYKHANPMPENMRVIGEEGFATGMPIKLHSGQGMMEYHVWWWPWHHLLAHTTQVLFGLKTSTRKQR